MKVSKDGKRIRKLTRDRKGYGHIEYHGTGKEMFGIYWIQRRLDQYHHKEQAWVIEADPVSAAKSYGAKFIGIECPCGTRYLTRADRFNPAAPATSDLRRERFMSYVDPWGRRGAMCWVAGIECWAIAEPPEEKREEMILKRMRIPRPRRVKSFTP
ncbi:hypothetical protein [Comamonas thiooxydans]|uniref:hypothetical protein n=1 Tax=Comamonas thiooxydans TaxID=363952 RepID=UPI0012E6F46F|nr:hypothetical protein [Comamonas thiooxydans]